MHFTLLSGLQQKCAYLSPGRSFTLAVISPASGVNFSTNSSGPQKDLFCPRNVFLAIIQQNKLYKIQCFIAVIYFSVFICKAINPIN